MKVAELNDLVVEIETRRDLIAFIDPLRHDIATDRDGWENPSTDRYLDAMAAWLDGPDDVLVQFGEDSPIVPSWRSFGKKLLASNYSE